MQPADLSIMRAAGGLLIAGAIIFFVGASIPLFTGLGVEVWSVKAREQLELIGNNRTAWQSTNSAFIVATVLTLAGFGLITVILHDRGVRLLAYPGLMIFLAGAVLWLVSLAFRLSVTLWAVDELTATAVVPGSYEPFDQLGETLLDIHMLFAYLTVVLYGGGFLRSDGFSDWLGWVCVGGGLFAAVSFVVRFPLFIFLIPAGTHIMPLVIGVVLLVGPQSSVL